MTKRTFVGGAITALAVALTVGSLVTASNMGFKLNYTLSATSAGVSKTGQSTLALPDNRQSGLNTSKNLMDDIGFANVQSIAKFLKATDSFQTYTGRKGSPGADFPLTSGEAVIVKMSTSVNYIAVGSDDPALAYGLTATSAGVSKTGQNFFAYNYHQTAGDSKQLMDDIGFANVQSIAKFLKATDAFQTYTGRKGSPGANFSLVPGEGYIVKMGTTVNYTPSHY
jgi:hypothetical protein